MCQLFCANVALFLPFISLLQLPCAASKSKNNKSPAVASPPSFSNPVLDDVVDDKEDIPFIPSSNHVSIMLFCFTFILGNLNFVI